MAEQGELPPLPLQRRQTPLHGGAHGLPHARLDLRQAVAAAGNLLFFLLQAAFERGRQPFAEAVEPLAETRQPRRRALLGEPLGDEAEPALPGFERLARRGGQARSSEIEPLALRGEQAFGCGRPRERPRSFSMRRSTLRRMDPPSRTPKS